MPLIALRYSSPDSYSVWIVITDIGAQIDDFKIRFSILQAKTEEELKNSNKTVATVSSRLRGTPLIQDTNKKYIKTLTWYNTRKPRSLEELLNFLNCILSVAGIISIMNYYSLSLRATNATRS